MKQQISVLTDFSNDLFFEIFDYLDVLHLFQAFENLNQRFNLLIIDRHICFQANMICLKPYEFPIYKNLLLPKIGFYIRYLSISDEFNYLQQILRSISFTNLIFVKLYHVKLNELRIILTHCKLKYLLIDTNYIQNEKHLNEIFRILFNRQLNLCSMQCHFHTNLYFVEEKYKCSQLKRVIIDCECFSSDFIVLISQLPKLRYLSARINDYNREYMDKDIDHLTGNESLRSLILHIENVELDRLLLILSLLPNVHILELNGIIDFDINHLFELERNYTSFRYMNSKFLSLIILYLIGLIFFLNGFLLTRRVILQNSNGTIPSSKPNEFNQIILMVIDALRYDFIKPHNDSIKNNYQNQMPFIRELLERKPNESILLRLIADPPTTTLQRLKALTTGTLPTFIDISYNFIGYEIEEDNILNQLKKNSYQREISLLGDDTWLALYPNIEFKHLFVYPSFDVHDLDTVDNGILRHLWTVIQETQHEQLSFIITHFLGVDHCGHRYGPSHIEMKRKLNQMNDVIRNITLSFDKSNSSSLLMVIGDHGMTQQGDHGGDELNEIETAMFLYTNKPNYFSLSKNTEKSVSQIDLVPTLCWFLHTLIPFSSLGMMIIDIIPLEQRYMAMKLNFEQTEIYLKDISLTLPLSDQLQQLRANLRTIFISFDRQRNLTIIENLFREFKFELQRHFRRQWSTFNISRIIFGLIIMLISCLTFNLVYLKLSINDTNLIFNISLALMYFAISFSNSFIINEGMCLYFLLQTIILITKMDILQKSLGSFLLFLSRAFLICREEQQPYCVDPLWLLSKSSDTSDYFLPFLGAIVWLIILILTCNYSYLLPYISFLSVVAYWFNIPYTLSIFYLSILIQICFVLLNPSRFDTLIYSILIFVIGYRFSFVIFLQYFIYYIVLNNSNRSLPLLLSLLAEYFFYATGHQPVLSQIRWTAAFPTINSPINNYLSLIINSLFVRGVFVLIETFSGQILNIIFIRKMIKKKYPEELLKHVLIIDCWKLLMTSLSVFVLRRHLMLWKIFSPRFLFQLVGFFIKFLFVFLTIKLKK